MERVGLLGQHGVQAKAHKDPKTPTLAWYEAKKYHPPKQVDHLQRLTQLREGLIHQEHINLTNSLERIRQRNYPREHLWQTSRGRPNASYKLPETTQQRHKRLQLEKMSKSRTNSAHQGMHVENEVVKGKPLLSLCGAKKLPNEAGTKEKDKDYAQNVILTQQEKLVELYKQHIEEQISGNSRKNNTAPVQILPSTLSDISDEPKGHSRRVRKGSTKLSSAGSSVKLEEGTGSAILTATKIQTLPSCGQGQDKTLPRGRVHYEKHAARERTSSGFIRAPCTTPVIWSEKSFSASRESSCYKRPDPRSVSIQYLNNRSRGQQIRYLQNPQDSSNTNKEYISYVHGHIDLPHIQKEPTLSCESTPVIPSASPVPFVHPILSVNIPSGHEHVADDDVSSYTEGSILTTEGAQEGSILTADGIPEGSILTAEGAPEARPDIILKLASPCDDISETSKCETSPGEGHGKLLKTFKQNELRNKEMKNLLEDVKELNQMSENIEKRLCPIND